MDITSFDSCISLNEMSSPNCYTYTSGATKLYGPNNYENGFSSYELIVRTLDLSLCALTSPGI